MYRTFIFLTLFFCIVDVEVFGIKLSQLALLGFMFVFIISSRNIPISLKFNVAYLPIIFYLIFILFSPLFYGSKFNLNWFFLNVFNLIFTLCFYRYLTALKIEDVIYAIKFFIYFVFILLIFDVCWIFLGLESIFKLFATDPIDGYKNNQLFSNEPNWLSILIFLLSLLVLNYEGLKNNRWFIFGVFFILMILSSRIVLMLFILSVISEFRSFFSFKRLFKLMIAASCISIYILFFTDIETYLYDLIFLEKNPRINDFIFYTNEAFDGKLSWFGKGASTLLEFQAPWRENSQIVVNSFLTQIYVEAGLVGLITLFLVIYKSLPQNIRLFAFSTLVLLVIHNCFFRQQYWTILALALAFSDALSQKMYRISRRRPL
jgi:hypothetical protein